MSKEIVEERCYVKIVVFVVFLVIPFVLLGQDDKEEVVKNIQKFLYSTTKMKFGKSLKIKTIQASELKEFFKKAIFREMSEEEIKASEKALRKFGLIPKNFDIVEGSLKLLSAGVGAFYYPETRELYLIEGRSVEDRNILTHELTHAAQDHKFGIDDIRYGYKHNSDRELAITSVIEGEACATMNIYRQIYGGGETIHTPEDIKVLLETPKVLLRTLTFPYTSGTTFVEKQKLRNGNDWAGVTKLYDDLPSSSEQIMHPEKYFGERDYPQDISLPDIEEILGDGWSELTWDVLGELVTEIVFEEFGIPRPYKVAAGWDGDKFVVLENEVEGKILLVWFTTWDSEEDASEFYVAYSNVIKKKYIVQDLPPLKFQLGENTRHKEFIDKGDNSIILIEQKGKDVLIIESAPPDRIGILRERIWQGVHKEEIKRVKKIPRIVY